jgi:hypothetical protein
VGTLQKLDGCQSKFTAFFEHPFHAVAVFSGRNREVNGWPGFEIKLPGNVCTHPVLPDFLDARFKKMPVSVSEFNQVAGFFAQSIHHMSLLSSIKMRSIAF